jgi:methylenetetrahydrofolate dehydrogenase (NADP+) / methenyltetrahydrofolate cyclohydrolase
MTAELLNGRVLSRTLNRALKGRIAQMNRPPGLAVVLVGSDPASQVYVKRKGVVAGRLGIVHRQVDLPGDTTLDALLGVLDTLNADEAIDGILVQLPLPNGLPAHVVIDRIAPDKDVDGITTHNTGRLAQGRPSLVPCTPWGVMKMLSEAGVVLQGKQAVVIGRSRIVGRPLAMLLEQANATVTVCHSRTVGLEDIVRRSELVVAALGRPRSIRGEWVRPGAVVIDVGVNRLDDGTLAGDVDFEGAQERASHITPVPGGVGPMTIAMLMENTWRASCRRQGLSEADFADVVAGSH